MAAPINDSAAFFSEQIGNFSGALTAHALYLAVKEKLRTIPDKARCDPNVVRDLIVQKYRTDRRINSSEPTRNNIINNLPSCHPKVSGGKRRKYRTHTIHKRLYKKRARKSRKSSK